MESIGGDHQRKRPCPVDPEPGPAPLLNACSRSGDGRINGLSAATSVRYTPGVKDPGALAGGGWFISIEGPDGAGKTTQAETLAEHLRRRGQDVLLTREPGGTWLGERVREILLARTDSAAATDPVTDAILFNAARRQLVTDVIRPALAHGRIVVCARYADSTLAYQGYGAGVPVDGLRALQRLATDGLQPHLTILLDLPVEAGLGRKAPGDVTRFEAEFDLAFHRRVRDGFLALATASPDRFVVIDAARPAEEVATAVNAAADRLIGSGEPKPYAARTS
jgi:dTMP kinase